MSTGGGAHSDVERRDRLRLARTDSIGPVTFQHLIKRFGSATRTIDALPSLALRGGRTTPCR